MAGVLISGLGGGAGFGEQVVDRNDDGSTAEIDVSEIFEDGLRFFGRSFDSLWVNTNGSVTFSAPRRTYTPTAITEASGNPEISPFFADVDTRGGAVSPTPGGVSQGTNLVYYDFDAENDRFVVTWDDVGYFNSHTDLLNSFQLILSDRGDGDFDIEFRYEEINWTTGDASDGVGGLGGSVAVAGYTAGTGNPAAYYELPASGNQDAILDLENSLGNTGEEGYWFFRVRSGDIATADLPAAPDSGATGYLAGVGHAVTMDGVSYDFRAAGEFVLLRQIDGGPFEVQVRMVPEGDNGTVAQAVSMRLGEHVVQIDAADENPFRVDGVATRVVNFGSLDVGGGRIYRLDELFVVVFPGLDGVVNDGDARLSLLVDDDAQRMDVTMELNQELIGGLEGLLGLANGDPADDIALPGGEVLDRPVDPDTLYGDYREAWRVTTYDQSLFTYDAEGALACELGETIDCFDRPDHPSNLLTIDDLDADIVANARIEALEEGLTEGTSAFDQAVFDYALTGDDTFIDSAEARADTTGTFGLTGVMLAGSAGADELSGSSGADNLHGLAGADRLVGRSGDDFLYGGDGADQINGGAGDDSILGGATAADGNDEIYAGTGADRVLAGHGDDVVFGMDGDDLISGGFGFDALRGQDGDDVISGGAQSDLIFGGDGDDFINGGYGYDRVNGGAGADMFYHQGSLGHGIDWVQDFSDAEGDMLVFDYPYADRSDIEVRFAETPGAGEDGVAEAFIVHPRFSQVVWVLIDGAELDSIDAVFQGGTYDLLELV
ncbi:hypothetical protein Ga0609869_002687 [Rhodovulum iodosum]|uniref:NIDO domain-containing protein n=1 Tax=Rhodovulum iodosum TaxID=68291 RepID=A0ABV3XWC3_9RHOB|nr:nidogen-like domain-containing protein [Rhodovulum robiginosum]RSK33492.1 hypothetical protein EJA01_09350 [Rhodovulum robiginosum]